MQVVLALILAGSPGAVEKAGGAAALPIQLRNSTVIVATVVGDGFFAVDLKPRVLSTFKVYRQLGALRPHELTLGMVGQYRVGWETALRRTLALPILRQGVQQ